jgi:hypothetical protein
LSLSERDGIDVVALAQSVEVPERICEQREFYEFLERKLGLGRFGVRCTRPKKGGMREKEAVGICV